MAPRLQRYAALRAHVLVRADRSDPATGRQGGGVSVGQFPVGVRDVDLRRRSRASGSGSRSAWPRRRARRPRRCRSRRRRPSGGGCVRSSARCSSTWSGRCPRRTAPGRDFRGPYRTGCSCAAEVWPSCTAVSPGRETTSGAPPVPRCVRWAARIRAIATITRDDRERREPARGVTDAPRDPVADRAGEGAQNARDLARGLAGAGRLDRQHVLEVGLEARHVGIALGAVLGRRPLDHGGRGSGDLRAQHLDVRELLADVAHRHRDGRPAAKRDRAREHLEQDHAQRVDVRLARDALAQGLLGRDVVGRVRGPARRASGPAR